MSQSPPQTPPKTAAQANAEAGATVGSYWFDESEGEYVSDEEREVRRLIAEATAQMPAQFRGNPRPRRTR